jgi:acyl-CoA thioesterase YciA
MTNAFKKPEGIVTIQTLAMPADTNAYGDIFGGWLVSQMDLAGGILAKHLSEGRAVTVAIHSMTFEQPVHVGDVVSCFVSLIKTGRTSLTIKIEVWTNINNEERAKKVTEGVFVYVAIDEDRHPRDLPTIEQSK